MFPEQYVFDIKFYRPNALLIIFWVIFLLCSADWFLRIGLRKTHHIFGKKYKIEKRYYICIYKFSTETVKNLLNFGTFWENAVIWIYSKQTCMYVKGDVCSSCTGSIPSLDNRNQKFLLLWLHLTAVRACCANRIKHENWKWRYYLYFEE